MKKVILKEAKGVYLNDITDEHLIGIEFNSGNKRVPIQISSNTWVCMGVGESPSYTSFSLVEGASIKKLIGSLSGLKAAYVFATRNELLEWLKN